MCSIDCNRLVGIYNESVFIFFSTCCMSGDIAKYESEIFYIKKRRRRRRRRRRYKMGEMSFWNFWRKRQMWR